MGSLVGGADWKKTEYRSHASVVFYTGLAAGWCLQAACLWPVRGTGRLHPPLPLHLPRPPRRGVLLIPPPSDLPPPLAPLGRSVAMQATEKVVNPLAAPVPRSAAVRSLDSIALPGAPGQAPALQARLQDGRPDSKSPARPGSRTVGQAPGLQGRLQHSRPGSRTPGQTPRVRPGQAPGL